MTGRPTASQRRAKRVQDHARWVADQNIAKQEKLDATRAERDKRIAALPEPFQRRIARFQRAVPNWRRDFEEYELFVCEEAQKVLTFLAPRLQLAEQMLDALAARNAVQEFHASGEQQKAAGISDEHSGNTFGMACRLANDCIADWNRTPTLVERDHGALCGMVGCKDYGCYAAYPKA